MPWFGLIWQIRAPVGPCADTSERCTGTPNFQICTSQALIGTEAIPAPNGGSARVLPDPLRDSAWLEFGLRGAWARAALWLSAGLHADVIHERGLGALLRAVEAPDSA
jgi:hypothetical protein